MHETDALHAVLVDRLRAAGCVFAEQEAELLIAEADSPANLEALALQRISGVPLEHLVGWVDFCGLRIMVDPGVFVPRRRTEFLVERAVAQGLRTNERSRALVVVDLCCGCGAIGAAIAANLEDIELYAADLDPVAVACARKNLEPLAGQVFAGDLFEALPEALRGRVDLLTANTPYVPHAELATMPPEARLYEPAAALDGGGDGLDVQRTLSREAPRWLAPGGNMLVETSRAQAHAAAAIFATSGLITGIEHDEERGGTVVTAHRRP